MGLGGTWSSFGSILKWSRRRVRVVYDVPHAKLPSHGPAALASFFVAGIAVVIQVDMGVVVLLLRDSH